MNAGYLSADRFLRTRGVIPLFYGTAYISLCFRFFLQNLWRAEVLQWVSLQSCVSPGSSSSTVQQCVLKLFPVALLFLLIRIPNVPGLQFLFFLM